MKLFTILRNLIQGIKSAVTESKNYTDSAIVPIDARLTNVEQYGALVDEKTVTGTTSITIPATSTWRFMSLSAYDNVSTTIPTYQTTVYSDQSFANNAVLVLGGYYYSGSDHGLCNLNISMSSSGGTVSLRNFRYAGGTYTSSAKLTVRFYK